MIRNVWPRRVSALYFLDHSRPGGLGLLRSIRHHENGFSYQGCQDCDLDHKGYESDLFKHTQLMRMPRAGSI